MTNQPAPAKVVIVEDDAVMLQELTLLCEISPDLSLLATAQDVQTAILMLKQPYDLLLLDLGLPDGSGLRVLEAHAARSSSAKCLVITVFSDREQTLGALALGANGYALKTDPGLTTRMQAVLAGEHPIDAQVAGHLLTAYRDSASNQDQNVSAPKLTPREQQTLCGLAEGLSYQNIAERLVVSPNTVTDYIKSLYKKLAVNSRSAAVYSGLKQGLIRIETGESTSPNAP